MEIAVLQVSGVSNMSRHGGASSRASFKETSHDLGKTCGHRLPIRHGNHDVHFESLVATRLAIASLIYEGPNSGVGSRRRLPAVEL